jgi:hypothetical protein
MTTQSGQTHRSSAVGRDRDAGPGQELEGGRWRWRSLVLLASLAPVAVRDTPRDARGVHDPRLA